MKTVRRKEETCWTLLKTLLLVQRQGAGTSLDSAIEMALDLYCESSNQDPAYVRSELEEISHLVWGHLDFDHDLDAWQRCYALYEKLLDQLHLKLS